MNLKLNLVSAAVTGALLSLSAGAAHAQASTPQKVDKIEVTGSSIKRIDGESALPITIITKAEIEKTGATNATDLLNGIAANAFGYNVSQGVGDSGQAGFAGVNLRGLGSESTLILLNGRRLANYALNGGAVDINSVPLSAVERVEILRDGASAIYGTDALGGVVNFILKKDYSGIDGAYYKTKVDNGGGDTEKYTLTLGYGDLSKQRFNILASFDQEKTEALLAKQRSFAKTGIRPDLGFAKTSGNVLPANFSFPGNTRGNINTSAAQGCVPSVGAYQVSTATGAPQPTRLNCRYDFTQNLDIFPPSDRKSAVVRGAFQLDADNQIFAEYIAVNTKFTFASSETPVNDFTGSGAFLYPAGGKYYPTTVTLPGGVVVRPTGDLSIAWRAQDGGRRTNQSDSDSTRLVVGATGTFATWDYNTAFSKAVSEVSDTYIDGWFYTSKLKPAIKTGVINVFSITGQDAAGAAALQAAKILAPVRTSEASTQSFDGKISKEIMQWGAGAVGAAFGVEFRKEKLTDTPKEVQFSGDIQGGGGSYKGSTGTRNVSAIFTEFSLPFAKTLEGTVALRYDKYSDFGNTTNPKFGFRWNPDKALLVRGSFNTGFRAPTLRDLYAADYTSNTAGSWDDPERCPGGNPIGPYVDSGLECEAQIEQLQGGNKALKPEKTNQWTLGVILEPTKYVSLGFDFWGINRKDTISSLSDATLFGNYAKYKALGYFPRTRSDKYGIPTPAGQPFPLDYVVAKTLNLGETKTAGIDFSFTARLPKTDFGTFKASFDGTYITKYDTQIEKGGQFFSNNGKYFNGQSIIRFRHTTALDWSLGDMGAHVAYNFTQGYEDYTPGRRVGNFETVDAQFTWEPKQFVKGLQFTFGVKNLLDRDPPASNQEDTFQVGYDPRYSDPRGRIAYGKLSYSWK